MIGPKLEKLLREWKPIWRPLHYKATLVALLVGAIVIPLLVLAMPYIEFFNDMAVQPKGKAQGEYGWYEHEALIVERPPVAGTVPMTGLYTYPIDGTDEAAAKRAGAELRNPLPATKEVQRRGQEVFTTICIVCHGERAEGDGKIVGPDLFPAPPSLHTPQALAFEDGRIFHVITQGQNKMPSYADRISPEDRWAVVHYVRAIQRAMEMTRKEGPR